MVVVVVEVMMIVVVVVVMWGGSMVVVVMTMVEVVVVVVWGVGVGWGGRIQCHISLDFSARIHNFPGGSDTVASDTGLLNGECLTPDF